MENEILYKIIEIHSDDAWYFTKELIDITGTFIKTGSDDGRPSGFWGGEFYEKDSSRNWYFYAVKLEEVK